MSSILALVTALLLSPLSFVSADGCKTFTPVQNVPPAPPVHLPHSNMTMTVHSPPSGNANIYGRIGPSYFVSDGAICPNSSTADCAVGVSIGATPNTTALSNIRTGGLVTDTRTLNITSTTSASASLFDLITKTPGINTIFNASTTMNVSGGFGFTLKPGDAGYAAYYVDHICTTGVLSGCTGDGYPTDGTAVEACTPWSVGDCAHTGCLGGTTAIVDVPVEEARAVNCTACDAAQKGAANAAGKRSVVCGFGMLVVGATIGFAAFVM